MTFTGIEGILFDKDGTLFDFHATWGAWAGDFLTDLSGGDQLRAQRLGLAIGYNTETRRFRTDSPVIAGTPGEVAECLLPLLPGMNPAALITRMNASAAGAPLQEAAALRPLMEGLQGAGLRLGVVTNDAEAPARAHLASSGIIDLLDFVAGCDSGYGAKPDAGQLLAFCQQTGIEPSRVVMVGDSRHDLIAGRIAGMVTVGVLTGLARAADLTDLADEIVPNVGHLSDLMMDVAA